MKFKIIEQLMRFFHWIGEFSAGMEEKCIYALDKINYKRGIH
jgi:hypothetical protein